MEEGAEGAGCDWMGARLRAGFGCWVRAHKVLDLGDLGVLTSNDLIKEKQLEVLLTFFVFC